jgi:apolipoprotein N-acyltransferase
MQLKKITRIGAMILFALSTIFWITIAMSDEADGGMITPMIVLSYLALFISTGLALYYSVMTLLKSPSLKKTLMYFGIFIAIFLARGAPDRSPFTVLLDFKETMFPSSSVLILVM